MPPGKREDGVTSRYAAIPARARTEQNGMIDASARRVRPALGPSCLLLSTNEFGYLD